MVVDSKPISYVGMTFDDIIASTEDPAVSMDGKNRDGSRVLAQVLGFKFAYYEVCSLDDASITLTYASSQSTEPHEATPRNLYLTTAILIREGFITLEDIYPHVCDNLLLVWYY